MGYKWVSEGSGGFFSGMRYCASFFVPRCGRVPPNRAWCIMEHEKYSGLLYEKGAAGIIWTTISSRKRRRVPQSPHTMFFQALHIKISPSPSLISATHITRSNSLQIITAMMLCFKRWRNEGVGQANIAAVAQWALAMLTALLQR